MKMRAIADEVEQLELEARLIEEEENGEYLPNPVQEAYQIPQLAALNNGGEDATAISADKPTPNESNRTARWVHDQTQQIVHTVNSTQGTWIDALEARDQTACGTATANGAGALSCPLPRLTLEKFDGDPLHWPRWIALFKALVHDRRELSNAERLTHLQTSLTGAARHAVSGLLCDGSLYSEALRELQCQFGSRATVVQASLRSVLQLPAVRSNDIPGLTELSRALHATVNVLGSMHYTADLAATTNVTAIVAKLPTSLAWKWGEYIQTLQNQEPTMTDLNVWLRAQVAAARAVVSGPIAETDRGREAGRRNWGHKPVRADRPAGVSATAAALPEDRVKGGRCGYCEGSHRVEDCDELTRLSVDERVRAVMKRAMCFRCLEPSHRARECASTQKCSQDGCASRRHHELLHGMKELKHYSKQADDSPPMEETRPVGVASVGRKDQMLLQIVPIYVHGPGGRKRANALLDMGSQISLIREDTALQLGLDGPVQSLRISTVDGSQTRPSRQVDFEIQPLSSDDRFQVTAAQTTPLLNVPGHAIDWPNEKLKWPHLEELNLQQTTSDEIEVLLGTDAFSLIVPRLSRCVIVYV